MSPHQYTEDQLVEQPAKRLLGELGWELAQPHPHPGPSSTVAFCNLLHINGIGNFGTVVAP